MGRLRESEFTTVTNNARVPLEELKPWPEYPGKVAGPVNHLQGLASRQTGLKLTAVGSREIDGAKVTG